MYSRVLSLSHSSSFLVLLRIPCSKLCYLKDKDALDFTFFKDGNCGRDKGKESVGEE